MINRSVLWSSAAKPVCEMGRNRAADSRLRDQAALFKGRAEVGGLLVRDDRAGVALRPRYWRTTSSNGIASWAGQSRCSIQRFATAMLARAAATSSETMG